MILQKVMLAGTFGVGKTSLFDRFVHGIFKEEYLTTIGVKVDSKEVKLDDGQALKLMIWDVAGEVSQDKVPKTYFAGTHAVIYVFDLARPMTYTNMQSDLDYLEEILPDAVIKVVGNKKDLVTEEQLADIKAKITVDKITSAKTGEQVEELFTEIANDLSQQIDANNA